MLVGLQTDRGPKIRLLQVTGFMQPCGTINLATETFKAGKTYQPFDGQKHTRASEAWVSKSI